VSVEARVAHLRRLVTIATWADAAAWALAVAAAGLVGVAVADAVATLGVVVRRGALPAAVAAGALAALWRLARGAPFPTVADVALWLDGAAPTLRFALVSALDPGVPAATRARCAAHAATVDLEGVARRALAPVWRRVAVAAVGTIGAALALPRGTVARVVAPTPGDGLVAPGAASTADPLARIVVRVDPPGYIGGRGTTRDDPAAISGHPGSRVRVDGVRAVSAPRARLDDRALAVTAGGGSWSVAFALPPQAGLLRLTHGRRERLLVVEPRVDSTPRVVLRTPERDSTLRIAAGALTVAADARDDLGLASLAVEYIITSGSGELFESRTGRLAGPAPTGRVASWASRLRLDTLRLGSGDVMHLRAVALDRNDVTGPGVGVSETRAVRIARADEYDSVAVDAVPPPEVEKDALSQRMLLLRTEALIRQWPRLARDAARREAGAIARDQKRLRQRVGQLVFERLEGEAGAEHSHFPGDGHDHGADQRLSPDQVLQGALAGRPDRPTMLDFDGDESPVVRINRPLLEAFNHMWDAANALDLVEPPAAVPPMRRALEALQRARAAERLYVRGRPPRVVVDVDRVRLTGRDTGTAAARVPRAPDDPAAAARLARFDRALGAVSRDAGAALDSLTVLRVDLLAVAPAAAAALGTALDRARRGGDATGPLVNVRRLLAGAAWRRDGLGASGTAW
jgi:hypothetical protein